MSDRLREELQKRNEASNYGLDDSARLAQGLPVELYNYHSLYPLEQTKSVPGSFGYSSTVYRATSSVDGKSYVLRRVEGFRLMNEMAMSTIDPWRRLRHVNIVAVREAFTTKTFGDHSLAFVYDYHPLSTTLAEHYFTPTSNPPTGSALEKTIWSFVCQIASALKTIHSAGLSVRVLDASKVLVTGKNRFRINCCGILDMLMFDGAKNVPQQQQEDLIRFGQLIVCLACINLSAIQNLPKSIDYLSRHFSTDLKNVVLYLLSKPSPMKTVDDVITMMGPRILHEINSAHHYNDFLESELSKELENGRISRLLFQLGFINERPEFSLDPRWSETGDRYLLKLFRDYLFHQVDENGRPSLDIGHVIATLNKLDAGIDEKIPLMSRDERTFLIVSYHDLKRSIKEALNDLRSS
ncbi:PAB-dependent poly(A)-specific ribonuclease subunit 3 [Gonapodya sp. JEL0774]|nr:PAB-dependent poly(A)-specific ribonuclease subunit 3 [Gonapodya sp. JEL0774]